VARWCHPKIKMIMSILKHYQILALRIIMKLPAIIAVLKRIFLFYCIYAADLLIFNPKFICTTFYFRLLTLSKIWITSFWEWEYLTLRFRYFYISTNYFTNQNIDENNIFFINEIIFKIYTIEMKRISSKFFFKIDLFLLFQLLDFP
jgi:hypothetical protein